MRQARRVIRLGGLNAVGRSGLNRSRGHAGSLLSRGFRSGGQHSRFALAPWLRGFS